MRRKSEPGGRCCLRRLDISLRQKPAPKVVIDPYLECGPGKTKSSILI